MFGWVIWACVLGILGTRLAWLVVISRLGVLIIVNAFVQADWHLRAIKSPKGLGGCLEKLQNVVCEKKIDSTGPHHILTSLQTYPPFNYRKV